MKPRNNEHLRNEVVGSLGTTNDIILRYNESSLYSEDMVPVSWPFVIARFTVVGRGQLYKIITYKNIW